MFYLKKYFLNTSIVVWRILFISILVFSFTIISCKKSEKPKSFIMMSEGIGENPDEKRKAVVIFDNNLAFFCLENSKESKYDYYSIKLEKNTWENFNSLIKKHFIENKINLYSSVQGSQKVELFFKIGSQFKRYEDISNIKLDKQDEEKIYSILKLVNVKKGRKIEYFPFKSKLLYEKLTIPPMGE